LFLENLGREKIAWRKLKTLRQGECFLCGLRPFWVRDWKHAVGGHRSGVCEANEARRLERQRNVGKPGAVAQPPKFVRKLAEFTL